MNFKNFFTLDKSKDTKSDNNISLIISAIEDLLFYEAREHTKSYNGEVQISTFRTSSKKYVHFHICSIENSYDILSSGVLVPVELADKIYSILATKHNGKDFSLEKNNVIQKERAINAYLNILRSEIEKVGGINHVKPKSFELLNVTGLGFVKQEKNISSILRIPDGDDEKISLMMKRNYDSGVPLYDCMREVCSYIFSMDSI